MSRSLMALALYVSLLTASCIAMAAPVKPQRLTAQEQSDLEYLIRHVDAGGRGAVDLSDPASRAAYLALLARHGMTPETRPYLFKTLEAAGMAAAGAGKSAGPSQKECQLPAEGEGAQNFREVLDVSGNADFSEVRAHALDSLVSRSGDSASPRSTETPEFVLDTLDVYDNGLDEILTSGTEEGYVGTAGDSSFDPRFSIVRTPLGENPERGPVTVVASFYYRTAKGPHAPCLVVIPGLEHLVPKDMRLHDPTNQKSKPGSPIVICLNRANQSDVYTDCDYGPLMRPGDPTPAHVKAVVSGNIVYNDRLAPVTQENVAGELAVVPRDTGGACVLSAIQDAAFLAHLSVVNDDELKFDWGRGADGQVVVDEAADFGEVCWGLVQNNDKWDFALALKAKTLNKSGKPTYSVLSSFLSEGPFSPEGTPNVMLLPPLVMQFGCIEKGAKIKMAGGQEQRIEDVRIGQKVVGENGVVYLVADKTTGTDNRFVEIRAGSPHRPPSLLSVTQMHPIAVAREPAANSNQANQARQALVFVPAKDLAIGDRIYLDGASDPVAISRLQLKETHHAAQVFNLTLKPADAAAGAAADDPSFYADGVLVGDNAKQGRFMAERRAAAAQLPKREIAGEERVDYEHWLKSRAAAQGTRGTRADRSSAN